MIRKSKPNKKKRSRNNPNKVNQYTAPDPRQALFFAYYFDPKSTTFANGLQSGLRAGFSQEYSQNLMSIMPVWLSESIEEMNYKSMLTKAALNIKEVLHTDHIIDAMGPFGPIINKETKKPYKRLSTSILKIKTDTSEFVVERLDRKRFGKDVKVGIGFQFNLQDDVDKYKLE